MRVGYIHPEKDNDPDAVTTTRSGSVATWYPFTMTIPEVIQFEDGVLPAASKGPKTTYYNTVATVWYTGTDTPTIPATSSQTAYALDR